MVRSVRKVPERSCIVCKQKKPKSGLLRVVMTSGSSRELQVDHGGKSSGRGSYICSSECLDKLNLKNINAAFKQEFKQDDLEKLKSSCEYEFKS